jgi:hypothetical protein
MVVLVVVPVTRRRLPMSTQHSHVALMLDEFRVHPDEWQVVVV